MGIIRLPIISLNHKERTMNEQYENRFGGIKRLYGTTALEKFKDSHVCVVGIGGVGSWVVESLARSGIGKITLIDMDDICVTNTNRQVHALADTVGKQKIEVMAERCKQINPDIIVNCIDDFIDKDNCFEHLSKDMDYIFDAIDSIHAKVALVAHCKRNKYPLLTCGGAGGQLDPTQIQVTDLAKTIQDPLAAKVRSELRRHFNFSKNPKRRFHVYCFNRATQLSRLEWRSMQRKGRVRWQYENGLCKWIWSLYHGNGKFCFCRLRFYVEKNSGKSQKVLIKLKYELTNKKANE